MKKRVPLNTEPLEGAEDYAEVIAYDRGARIFMAPMHWLAARAVIRLLNRKATKISGTGAASLRQAQDRGYAPTVLDLGAGTGRFALMLLKKDESLKAVGLDLSGNMLKCAKENIRAGLKPGPTRAPPRLELIRANADALPFKAGVFDVVMSAQSLHHWNSPEKVLKEADRVVRENGKVAVFDGKRPKSKLGWTLVKLFSLFMNKRHRGNFPKVYESSYTVEEAKDLLERAGLSTYKAGKDLFGMGLKIIKE